jgi:hypothetical protein
MRHDAPFRFKAQSFVVMQGASFSGPSIRRASGWRVSQPEISLRQPGHRDWHVPANAGRNISVRQVRFDPVLLLVAQLASRLGDMSRSARCFRVEAESNLIQCNFLALAASAGLQPGPVRPRRRFDGGPPD